MSESNGLITYERQNDQGKFVTHTVRGVITPKRVKTATRTWNHEGLRVSAYHSGMRTFRLLSFQVDGEPPVVIGTPM